ncbi:hypothetical protein EV188_10197 [Actinomycetospora succinea]|uniref:Uncharacterized protein n=1 Tax=Actinomycetospora succinea TaxID=663603 RepID=A0A4R6VM69_9PSEU|nr:hypothetical protein [Actinomycetospora succinea]TDQ64849.1 hypothetical protein EV188_10197 [Actinomycetospora succinea]
MARSVVVPLPSDLGAVHCGCAPSVRRSAHHDRLLAVETDPDAVLDLFEIAVTWGELDYTGAEVLAPEAWLDFASDHVWRCPDRVIRLFALASDVALRGAPVRCAAL